MGIKRFKPQTPSLRHTQLVDGIELTRNTTVPKSLLAKKQKIDGRNHHGRITLRRRGGSCKRKYRIVDFKRNKINIPALVKGIVYDPNRSCHLALISYKNGDKSLILAPNHLKVGDEVISSDNADIRVGNAKRLGLMPVGTLVHNVELYPGAGGQFARSAGSGVQVMAKEGRDVLLRMPSGELRKVKENCMATIGQVGNLDKGKQKLGKAGRNRLLGRRPKVRGVAMNPVDHPHGGGEGRTSGGRHPVTPWGVSTKGHKTRKNKRTDKFIVRRRKKK